MCLFPTTFLEIAVYSKHKLSTILFPTTFLEIAVYSKHKLSTTLVANGTNLFRFVALTF